MNWADYLIIAILLISAGLSLVRGFMREVISLIVWVLAFWLAWQGFQPFSTYLGDWIHTPSLRLGVAFVLIFIGVLVAGGLVGWILGMLVDLTGLSGTDRLLGMLFGLVRGAVLVAILVFLAGLTPLPQDPWWHQSQLIPQFKALAEWLMSLLPPDIAAQFQYGPT